MWLCCPSALSPMVGPKVESDTGEPASPHIPETATMTAVADGLNPNFRHSGTYTVATIGIVEKQDPMPTDIKNPTDNIPTTANI